MPRDYVLKTPQTNDSAPAFVRKAMTWAKSTNELHGLLRGVLSDGTVSESEALFVKDWFSKNEDVLNDPLVSGLFGRLCRVFDDRIVTPEELEELRVIFSDYTGDRAGRKPTTLPLCSPAPEIIIQESRFCFTGTFASGKRSWCQEQVILRGGTSVDSVSSSVTVLVIGSQVSDGWANQSYGRKIESAVGMRSANRRAGRGNVPAIIAEDHWLMELNRHDLLRSSSAQ